MDDGEVPSERAARDRMIAAGRRLAAVGGVGRALPSVRAVCEAAGLSTSSFYWAFDGLSGFSAELASELVLEALRSREVSGTPADDDALSGALGSWFGEDASAFAVRITLLGLARDDALSSRAVRTAHRSAIDAHEEDAARRLVDLLAAAGGRARDPFDARTIVATVSALADGLRLRSLFGDTTDTVTLLEDAVAALLTAVTEAVEPGEGSGSLGERAPAS